MQSGTSTGHIRAHIGLLLVLILLFQATPEARASSNSHGSISGRITDTESGEGVAYAQVVLPGTTRGVMANEDGTFVLRDIPPGAYELKIMMIGYHEHTEDQVVVGPGQHIRIDIAIEPALVDIGIPEVVVTAPAYKDYMNTRSETIHKVKASDMTSIAADQVEEVLALKPGVLARAGQLFVRGSRADAVLVMVDGIPVRDPLAGQRFTPLMLALESAEIVLGGLEAQYGNAKAGIINYETREGQDTFEAEVRYLSDRVGEKYAFDNLDRLFVGLGGPSPVENLTYYVSAEGSRMDDYPRTSERRPHHRVLNLISLGDRKTNSLKVHGKLAYRPFPHLKTTLEAIHDRTQRDEYHHMWSWEGYVETYLDTTRTGRVDQFHGRVWSTPLDSTYVYYNAAEHTPDIEEEFNQLKLVLNHALGESVLYSLKLSRYSFSLDQRVQDKEPWEYLGSSDYDFWYNHRDGTSSPFFVIAGDYPLLSTRETTVYTSKFDITHTRGDHRIQTGFEIDYNDMRFFRVERPYRQSLDGQIGSPNTRYHYYSPEGSIYIQDQWNHEGMVLNLGVRFDALSVGNQIPISEVRNRWKTQLSPRLGVAYPISERDVFSFHYGRFCQFPERQYVFDNQRVYENRVQGNRNLEHETSTTYQAGVQHLFSTVLYGQLSVYYKDIFGLITAEEIPDPTGPRSIVTYVNKDYASSRGFELSLIRSFRNGFRGELSYTYGVATGVASDPKAAVSQDFIYLPVTEQPLSWDVRHQLSAHLFVANPGNWGVDMVWSFLSGLPYTPVQRHTRELRPQAVNSKRLPSTAQLNINAEKYFGLWGQRAKVFVTALNVLDTKNIETLAPVEEMLQAPSSQGHDYEIYYSETGRAGGAYLGDDVTGDGIVDWVPLHDPLVFAQPRTVRLGIGLRF